MTSTSTNILKEATEQYNKGGLNSAGGYVLVIMGLLLLAGIVWYVKRNSRITEENMKQERKENKELQDKLFKMFEESINRQYNEMSTMNKEIISEVKTISDSIKNGMTNIIENNLKANEMLYAVIESSNDKILTVIDEKKSVRIEDYEKQVKLINENNLYKLKDSLETRIMKNNLFELKTVIAEEIDSMIENMVCKFKDEIKDINYPNDTVIHKFNTKYDSIIKTFKSEIITLFDVQDKYNKDNLLRSVKSDIYKVINKINILNLNNL